MQVKFDSLNRFEVPKFYICNPGSVYTDGVLSNVVGCLSDTTGEELVMNFNSVSELNFRVIKVRREDPEENQYATKLFKALQNRRMIFVDNIGYFIITNVDDGYADKTYYKDVRAESCEIEIRNKLLTYIEDGTYKFTDLLEKIVSTLPLWTIGFVDDAVAEKYRTFEDANTDLNTLDFILEKMQDAYECIFAFDTIRRQISVYDQNNYVVQTDIHITKDDLINTIEIAENSDNLYTALSVLGDDDLNIAPINPLGTNVIYNFDYYLDWMTDSLRSKVKNWKELVGSKMSEYYTLNLSYYEKLTLRSDYTLNLRKLETRIDMYRRCRENIVAEGNTDAVEEFNKEIEDAGGTPIDISSEVEETKAAIDNQIALAQDEYDVTMLLLSDVELELNTLNSAITEIHNSVSMSEYFSEDEYDELYNYIFEGSYHDEYITVSDIMTYSEKFQQMKALYDRAVFQLERTAKPSQEFSIDVENFIFVKEFENWSDQLETGSLINVELETDDVAMLFLSNITVNYDDRSLNLTFGNRFTKFDPKALFGSMLGNIKKSSNTLGYIREIVYPIKNGELNAMKEALEISRTLTKNSVLASTNEEVVIDDTGYTGRRMLSSGQYDPRQVKITGKTMVFTDDAWESCKVALGELLFGDGSSAYGINAKVLIGDAIIGNNLRILDNNGNDLFTVVDGKIESSVRGVRDDLETLTQVVQGEDGLLIRVSTLENTDVSEVTTSTGYTFNADGLTIYETGSNIKNLLNNEGMYVSRIVGEDEESILVADADGVDALNLRSRQFLIIGENSRFENYDNGVESNRTACFHITLG